MYIENLIIGALYLFKCGMYAQLPQEMTAVIKIGPRCGHVWLTSYPGPRGFFCLFAALVLSSYAEKNQENPL